MQALVAATVGNGAPPAGHGAGSSRAATQDTPEVAENAVIDAEVGAEASEEAGVDVAGDTAMAEASDSMVAGPEVPKDAMAKASDSMVDGPEVSKGAAIAQELSTNVAAVEAGTPGKPVGSASPEEDKPGWAS